MATGQFAITCSYGALEAFAFSALVLADIWLLHPRGVRGDVIVLAVMAVSFVAHGETMASLGLDLREARAAIREWAVPLVACAVALFLASLLAMHRLDLLIDRGLPYFIWCVLQQLLLQNMVYRRVRMTFGPVWSSYALTGCLFAAAHLPNPVLVPATLFWGTAAARLFERCRSIISLALLQTLLSSMLLWITPASLNHQFHVGPGYWRHHSGLTPTRVLIAVHDHGMTGLASVFFGSGKMTRLGFDARRLSDLQKGGEHHARSTVADLDRLAVVMARQTLVWEPGIRQAASLLQKRMGHVDGTRGRAALAPPEIRIYTPIAPAYAREPEQRWFIHR